MTSNRDQRAFNRNLNRKNRNLPTPEPDQGSLGDRQPDTGEYEAKIVDGGQYPVRRLYESSHNDDVHIQLNPNTRTGDYRSHRYDVALDDQRVELANNPATGIPKTPPSNEDDPNDVNPSVVNCFSCWIGSILYGNGECIGRGTLCRGSQFATIYFNDGDEVTVEAPCRLEYGVKLVYQDNSGRTKNAYFTEPIGFTVILAKDTLPGENGRYGTLIYQQLATAFNIGSVSVADDAIGFQLYRNNEDSCNLSIVRIDPNGGYHLESFLAPCDSLAGSYTVSEVKDSLRITNAKGDVIGTISDVDPTTIAYECVIRIYSICTGETLTYRKDSDGTLESIASCGRLNYEVTNDPAQGIWQGRDPQYGALKYTGQDNLTFTVDHGGELYPSSNNAVFWQIYQDFDNPCLNRIVEVVAQGDYGFSGAISTTQYNLIHTANCGTYKIVLGSEPLAPVLNVYDKDGKILLITRDFVENTIDKEFFEREREKPSFEKSFPSTVDTPIYAIKVDCR